PRCGEGAQFAGSPRETHAARGRARRKFAGGISQDPRTGAEALGEGRQGLGSESRMKRASTRLRELIARGPTLYLPGCYNAMSAKVLEDACFEGIYMTG